MSGFPAVEGDLVEVDHRSFPKHYTEVVQVDGITPYGFIVLGFGKDGEEEVFPWEGFEHGHYEVVEND